MRQPPKHIIISHVYSSDNKGDAALTSVLIKDLKRTFKKAHITILALQPTKDGATFEGIPESLSFMSYVLSNNYHPLLKLIRAIYMMCATIIWAMWYKLTRLQLPLPKQLQYTAKLYAQADLIVPVGGGYLRSREGLVNRMNIPLLVHPLLFGYMLGKPTVLYSQTVGPFKNSFERRLVSFVLRRMTLILLREDKSVNLLFSMGVYENVARAIDSGFLLESKQTFNIRKLYHIPPKRLLIGVTVRTWLKGDAQINYEKSVAKALDDIVEEHGAHVILIPQVTAGGDDDRMASRRVLEFMHHNQHATLVTDTPNHHEIKAFYDGLDLLVGTRFHSVIFSLTSYVPVVAIEYEHKTSGIMRDLKLEDWVIKIEHVTAKKLSALLKRLVSEQKHYKKVLQKTIPPYIDRARQTADLLAEGYFAES